MNKILVTGSNSGLGKHCSEYFESVPFSRQTDFTAMMALGRKQPFRAIIHSAFNPRPSVNTSELYGYLNDTLLLTKKLLQIPHEKFIFISSVDVYPRSHAPHHEDEEIQLREVESIYGISKLMSESIVRGESTDFLILRPTALLGEHARKNSLMKILTQSDLTLTLAGQSTFNYVLHGDVTRFIDKAITYNLTGIYNIAASSNVTLNEVCERYQRRVTFGQYQYQTGIIDNHKAITVLPELNVSSLENIERFMPEILVDYALPR